MSILHGDGATARISRSFFWTITGFGGAQALRLGSNLILTRLLFPEAFGLMALITAVMVGLSMFSDVGIAPSIQQSPRGDDPRFLDTAWTIQAIRGVLLCLGAAALALPMAHFYAEPQLAQLLPVAGLALILDGLRPTRVESAGRHLRIGRVTCTDLAAQLIGLIVTVALAWALQSIWALVFGLIAGSAIKTLMLHLLLPGQANRFHWDAASAQELIGFGKWIFLSTICGFLVQQGDRLILGKYLTIDMLGIYTIGFFLASFPRLLGTTAMQRLMIPIYRLRPPAESAENFRAMRRMRFALSGGLLALVATLSGFGPELIAWLYDPRYAAAGGILVLISCITGFQIVGLTYDRASLAAGDSRSFFALIALRAATQTGFFILGAEFAGLVGALIGQGLSVAAVYPAQVRLARRHGVWDALHDALFAGLALAVALVALWMNQEAVIALWEGLRH